MIVCSCNVLTDVAIRTSIATLNGPRRVCDVYASLGCAAKCGGCAGAICALLSEAKGKDVGVESIKLGREAKRKIDACPCEGHRQSQSGSPKRADDELIGDILFLDGELKMQSLDPLQAIAEHDVENSASPFA